MDAEPFDSSDFPEEAVDPETFNPEEHRDPVSLDVDDWEKLQNQTLHRYLYPKDETQEDAEARTDILVYTGRISPKEWLEEHRSETPEDAPETLREAPYLHRWRMRRPISQMKVTTNPDAPEEEWHTLIDNTGEQKRGEVYGPKFYTRPGGPTYTWIVWAALYVERIQSGRFRRHDSVRTDLVNLIRGTALRGPDFQVEVEDGTKRNATKPVWRQLLRSADEIESGANEAKLHPDFDPRSLPVHGEGDAPAPRPETPEFNPSPFQGDGETAGMLSGPFSSAVARSLVETPDEAASQRGRYEEEWGADSTGHPIRVEELNGQYSGRVTLRVQAYGEPDPTAVDAEMGWAMLQEMEMEEVWLHAFLLAHASAPGRRGEREVIRIPRTQIEQLPMGFRSRNRGKWERAEKIKEHIDRLRSVFVQFQNVERHGDKLRFRHDMNATPLWSLRMVAEGEQDLFTGEEWSEWYLEAREGMWAEEFLHNHGEQWAPLPKEWFEQIDRRGSDWGQRLAVLLLFLFRTNRKHGGRVKLSAAKMLQACGVDLSVERDSSDRYDLKQKLSSALEDLHHNYGMRVQDGDVNVSKIDGRSYWTDWKNQTVTIDPPEKIDRRLLSGEGPERAPLPDTRPGRWSKKQIERLLNELGWTQKRLASELPVGKQSVSHYLNDRRTPSDEVRAALDRIQARHL